MTKKIARIIRLVDNIIQKHINLTNTSIFAHSPRISSLITWYNESYHIFSKQASDSCLIVHFVFKIPITIL